MAAPIQRSATEAGAVLAPKGTSMNIGIIAGAMGGAAGALGEVAQRHIEDQRRGTLAKQMADIDEQKALRIDAYRRKAEREDALDRLTGQQAAAQLEFTARSARAAAARALDQKRAEIPVDVERGLALTPIEVERQRLVDQARHDAETAALNDPRHLQGLRNKTAATETAASRAATAESAARTRILGVELDAKRLTLEDQQKLGALYEQAASLNANPAIGDAEKVKRLSELQQQVALIKAKNGQGATGPREQDMTTIERNEIDPKTGAETKTTTREVRRPGGGVQVQPGAARGPWGSFAGQSTAGVDDRKPSQVPGRKFAAYSTAELAAMLKRRDVPWLDKADIEIELDVRKRGDIAPL
ncbi:hypothetical protein HLB44_16890 [Aquincola sp. S2]|uniref:Uncharacterized protein n=1 Tax=Pseudaquabacterium terrae TaxID=2732868 RepID=A0ABX2EJB9_9BURK|nr:hypothetical protein [Aquabacterium terrae]NRF68671.1 hypothetical protein [Aquabacterium terrae]